jgi:hypothetical protein
MLDILNPTVDDVKLLTTMAMNGHDDLAEAHVDKLAEPALRVFAKQTLSVLAEIKADA